MVKVTIGDKELNFPDDLLYSDKHQWVSNDGKIGISDYAQSQLGEIITADLEADDMVGMVMKAGDLFEDISVEAQKAVADIYSPVSGKVTEANEDLEDAPEKINEDPYGEGWLFKMEITEKPSTLMNAAKYVEYLKTL